MNVSLFFILILLVHSDKMFCWNYIKNSCFKTKKNNVDTFSTVVKDGYEEYLKNVEYKDTVRFVPPILNCKVIKVYDGDTITVASKIPDTNLPVYRFSVRLRSIDSPEIHGETTAEKDLAIVARDALNKLIYGKIIVLKNLGTEKYGRILADVYVDNLHVNKWMLDNNYAVPYNGGKKMRPAEWE